MSDLAMNQNLLTYEQAAKQLGVKKSFIRTRVRQGKIEVRKLGANTRRITPMDLARYVESTKGSDLPKRPMKRRPNRQ